MFTPAPVYKKVAADVVYHSAVVGLGAAAISYGLEETKIVARTELKFDMKDRGKLLVVSEWLRQMMVDKKWIPASLFPNNYFLAVVRRSYIKWRPPLAWPY